MGENNKMNNYYKLAFRYLKMNRKRSVVTVLGVVVATALLYLILNLSWSGVLKQRETAREKQDYEIVFLTETSEQIEQITGDERVKNAKAGRYFDYDYYRPKNYDNALYVNTTNPYRMNSIREKLEEKYQVKGCINEEIAWTYLQGNDGSIFVVVILAVILVSFFFAVFGVGIVRNSIQLSTLEQIKDYGNLRCIGSTKGQLKRIIYTEGAVLEGIGILIGVLLATIISIIIGHSLEWPAGFHFVPLVPVLIAFFGDLYFVMEENCKVISNMTPVSAIRGEYRIKKEKIKVRKRSIYGKLFGIEGDYAYKNIMRNPARFRKTVWSLGVGMALFVAIMGCLNSVYRLEKDIKDSYKYYQVYFENTLEPRRTADSIKSSLPPYEILEKIANLEGVTDVKRIYSATLSMPEGKDLYAHYTEEYLSKTWRGNMTKEQYDKEQDGGQPVSFFDSSSIRCHGYDEEDYERLKKSLIEGTLDVSENGILLVNCGEEETADFSRMFPETVEITYTDYKVGDEIQFLDVEKLYNMVQEEMQSIWEEYEVEKEALLADIDAGKVENPEEALTGLFKTYENGKGMDIEEECKAKLIEQGAFKTYVIEGILKDDANRPHDLYHGISVILPMENYFKLTGTDESVITGMMYHFDEFSFKEYERAVGLEFAYQSGFISTSMYPMMMNAFDMIKSVHFGIIGFVLFIVAMTAFNVINTTASNLHLRRKEFAQLRVIGVSKKGLMKMIMLEGVIETIAACIIGAILGGILSFITFEGFVSLIYKIDYQFPLGATLIALAVSILILCGTTYLSLKGMPQDVAGDLVTGGE